MLTQQLSETDWLQSRSGSMGTEFAVTTNNVFVGVVTDHDTRRLLLVGLQMSEP